MTEDERALVETDLELLAEVARLRQVRALLADQEPPSISRREEHLAAALGAWDRLPEAERTGAARDITPAALRRGASPASAAAAATITTPTSLEHRRRAAINRRMLGAAAAIVLVLAGGVALQTLSSSSDDEASSSAEASLPLEEAALAAPADAASESGDAATDGDRGSAEIASAGAPRSPSPGRNSTRASTMRPLPASGPSTSSKRPTISRSSHPMPSARRSRPTSQPPPARRSTTGSPRSRANSSLASCRCASVPTSWWARRSIGTPRSSSAST